MLKITRVVFPKVPLIAHISTTFAEFCNDRWIVCRFCTASPKIAHLPNGGEDPTATAPEFSDLNKESWHSKASGAPIEGGSLPR